MARASWKLCSMSGLHTPSASLSSPLSRLSDPSSRASPGLLVVVQLLDAIVLAALGSGPEPLDSLCLDKQMPKVRARFLHPSGYTRCSPHQGQLLQARWNLRLRLFRAV